MDQRLQRNFPQRLPVWHTRLLRKIARATRGESCRRFPSPSGRQPGHPLPPTRAARPKRSRGFFFGGPSINRKPPNDVWRRRLALIATFTTMASILVLAIVPFLVEEGAFNANPGPGLVGATSIPPSFVSARTRL